MSRSPGTTVLGEFVRASYRRKLAAALLAVAFIVSLAAVGLYVQVGVLLGENVEQSMTAAADAEANELTEWADQYRLVARVLSESPVYDGGDEAAVRGYLRSGQRSTDAGQVVDVYVVDRRSETVVASADRRLEGRSVADLPWEERFAFQGFDEVRLTRPYESREGETVVGFITPIRRLPGHLLVVTVDTATVFDRFEHPVEGGFTRVVNSNGTVVFASDEGATLRQYRSGGGRSVAVERGLRGESGVLEDAGGGGGERVIAAYAPVEGADWVVIEHAPAGNAYALLERTRLWIGAIGVVALLGLLGVVAVVGANATAALSRLVERAKRIERGEYDVEFETDRPDEFGDLNRALASTQGTLRERIGEIEATSAELERSKEALEERSSMVAVLNRILRHNVRNDVSVIAGRAAHIAEHVDDDELGADAEGIRRTALDLADIADRTQRIKHLLAEDRSGGEEMVLSERLPRALDEIRPATPAASIEFGAPGPVVAEAMPTLPTAVADVVGQIVAHNGGSVTVSVTCRNDGEGAVVAIDDDGDGLPDLDVEAVGAGEETPLRHAEGLALWCLEWTANKVGGELTVETAGATVEVRLPGAEGTP